LHHGKSALEEARGELAVAVEDQHEAERAARELRGARDAGVARARGGERRAHVELYDFGSMATRQIDASVGGSRVDVHRSSNRTRNRFEAPAQALALVASDGDCRRGLLDVVTWAHAAPPLRPLTLHAAETRCVRRHDDRYRLFDSSL